MKRFVLIFTTVIVVAFKLNAQQDYVNARPTEKEYIKYCWKKDSADYAQFRNIERELENKGIWKGVYEVRNLRDSYSYYSLPLRYGYNDFIKGEISEREYLEIEKQVYNKQDSLLNKAQEIWESELETYSLRYSCSEFYVGKINEDNLVFKDIEENLAAQRKFARNREEALEIKERGSELVELRNNYNECSNPLRKAYLAFLREEISKLEYLKIRKEVYNKQDSLLNKAQELLEFEEVVNKKHKDGTKSFWYSEDYSFFNVEIGTSFFKHPVFWAPTLNTSVSLGPVSIEGFWKRTGYEGESRIKLNTFGYGLTIFEPRQRRLSLSTYILKDADYEFVEFNLENPIINKSDGFLFLIGLEPSFETEIFGMEIFGTIPFKLGTMRTPSLEKKWHPAAELGINFYLFRSFKQIKE